MRVQCPMHSEIIMVIVAAAVVVYVATSDDGYNRPRLPDDPRRCNYGTSTSCSMVLYADWI